MIPALIGMGLSVIGGLSGRAAQKRQMKEQKKAMAINASETRKGLALQASQTQQATQGAAMQALSATEQAEGVAQTMTAEGGVGGNLAIERTHGVAHDASQAFSGLALNLNNQLAQNRMAANASQQSYRNQVKSLKPDDLLATLLNSASPYIGSVLTGSGIFGKKP